MNPLLVKQMQPLNSAEQFDQKLGQPSLLLWLRHQLFAEVVQTFPLSPKMTIESEKQSLRPLHFCSQIHQKFLHQIVAIKS